MHLINKIQSQITDLLFQNTRNYSIIDIAILVTPLVMYLPIFSLGNTNEYGIILCIVGNILNMTYFWKLRQSLFVTQIVEAGSLRLWKITRCSPKQDIISWRINFHCKHLNCLIYDCALRANKIASTPFLPRRTEQILPGRSKVQIYVLKGRVNWKRGKSNVNITFCYNQRWTAVEAMLVQVDLWQWLSLPTFKTVIAFGFKYANADREANIIAHLTFSRRKVKCILWYPHKQRGHSENAIKRVWLKF